jgi:hypothetical protein
MNKTERLIQRLEAKPHDFTFAEMETLVTALGFKRLKKSKADEARLCFVRGQTLLDVRKPKERGVLLHYQMTQILTLLERKELI